jgi:hypothetical protein
MKKKKNDTLRITVVFFAALIILTGFLQDRLEAMNWPSETAALMRNFGWNDRGLPCLGISFESSGEVKAADNGELLFCRREGDTASGLPSPLGSWIALDHGDGIISVYARMDYKQSRAPGGKVEKGMALGEAGISGWSGSKGFYFQLFDRKEKRWINPSLIITPPEDIRAPEIMSVRLKNAQGELINPYQTYNMSQGRYTVLVNAIDTLRIPGERPLAPHRIICTLNGSESGVLNFETYSSRDGQLMVYRNGLVPVRQVYAPGPYYEVADVWFSRGQTTLEIIAQDIAGNIRNVYYRITVE